MAAHLFREMTKCCSAVRFQFQMQLKLNREKKIKTKTNSKARRYTIHTTEKREKNCKLVVAKMIKMQLIKL